MIRFLAIRRFLPYFAPLPSVVERNNVILRFFSSKTDKSATVNPFITIPEEKITVDINRYKSVGGNSTPNDTSCRVVVSFNVNEAEWMPENIKQIFKQQQALRIDESGNFTLISGLHRSVVSNKVEVMKKLQKKVNQACISTVDKHTIGVVDPINNEKRLKEKRRRSELSRKRRQVDKDYDEEEFF